MVFDAQRITEGDILMYQAVIRCPFDLNLLRAFQPEESQDKRASFQVVQKKDAIELQITAQDAVSLRAMMASLTRLLAVYEKTN